jgi:hypothetical protein
MRDDDDMTNDAPSHVTAHQFTLMLESLAHDERNAKRPDALFDDASEAVQEFLNADDLIAIPPRPDVDGDPYSYAMFIIKSALEYALDDGVNGAMSQGEFEILESIARKVIELDPSVTIEPRPA